MEKEPSSFLPINNPIFMKESLRMISFMEKVHLISQMVISIRAHSQQEKNMEKVSIVEKPMKALII
jgi:hypothetical protein